MAENDEVLIVSYLGLRKTIGGVGFMLPIVLIIAGLFAGDIEPSISHFYYTCMQDYFVGSLCVIGLFLMSYRGFKPEKGEWLTDRKLGWIGGGAAILVAFFPTAPLDATSEASSTLHFIFAAIFLFSLGIFSFFKFTRSNTPKSEWGCDKLFRKWTYRVMGTVIFACLIVIGIIMFLIDKKMIPDPKNDWLFWLESIAVWAFSISWLVKGEAIQNLQGLRKRIFSRKP
ncbi:MAG: hypothetical protein V3V13_02065 [Paracoccaceae bacterium]